MAYLMYNYVNITGYKTRLVYFVRNFSPDLISDSTRRKN